MERRLVIFFVLTLGILLASSWLMPKPPRPRQQPGQVAANKLKPAADREKKLPKAEAEKPTAEKPAAKSDSAATVVQPASEPETPEQWVTLGSADKNDPYRMLVTLTNKGAAVARIELASSLYCDVDDRSGYLGHLVMNATNGDNGCEVQVVGPGTPAAEAGLKPGDLITAVKGKPVTDLASLEAILEKSTKPKQTVEIAFTRNGEKKTCNPTLRRRPLEVIKPEGKDPLSMLMTLQQFDAEKIASEAKKEEAKDEKEEVDAEEKERLHDAAIGRELDGVKLRTANWKLVSSDQTHAQFRRVLPERGLEITKTYRLTKVPDASLRDENFPAYHLEFEIEIRNIGDAAHKVAYRLDGPNGLPTEGKWYTTRVTRKNGSGIRDFVISFGGQTPAMVGATTIATDKLPAPWREDNPERPLTYIGVDAQYFSAVLMPQREKPTEAWFDELAPLRVGKVDLKQPTLTNASCRLIGKVQDLKAGEVLVNRFKFFAGPKKAAVLENGEYRLGDLIYFGWPIFAVVAVPLTAILHAFFAVVQNYGLAIILLTLLVRGCMFPLTRKQTLGMQKMQALQPEIKKIQEKHKNNAEARTKAQQELFRKHNYNPLAGCLPIFIQMPVFIGLYRSLMVAIELRDAPLISHSVRWCSNLAAPDMLLDWRWLMPAFVSSGMEGIFSLGPYFNLLPILSVILIIFQQKITMPPPADEQAAMQQKIMQYMMLFMGLMFFKVASGLCIYFIVQSLWGFVERKFLPKTAPVAGSAVETRADAKARARQVAEAAQAKKSRVKK